MRLPSEAQQIRNLKRELNQERLEALAEAVSGLEAWSSRVAALEAAQEQERLCWIEALKRAVERGALSSTEEYRIHSEVGEERARVQPAQGREEGERG